MINILYGCCYKGLLFNNNVIPGITIDYVDIVPFYNKNNGNFILSDIKDIDFNKYDLIILSPPCNYWSKANYRRDTSYYALATKDLLPYCIDKAIECGKFFIVENVRNPGLFDKYDLFNKSCFYYFVGRHTYWSNVLLPFLYFRQQCDDINHISRSNREGGKNVEEVFNFFLTYCLGLYYNIGVTSHNI